MKLTVLGGSAAGGNTGQGCAGFLVQEGETSVIIDLGPGTLLELRKHVDYRMVTAIVISHYHLDHILDLGALRYLVSYNPRQGSGKIDLWIPPNTGERFAKWAAAFSNNEDTDFLGQAFNIAEYYPQDSLAVGALRFRFAPTVHPEQGWAMRITGDGGREIGYTADTGPAADLGEFFAGVAVLVSEATEADNPAGDSATRGHLTAREAGELARATGAACLLLTHMWEESGIEGVEREASLAFGGTTLVARPGLSLIV